MKPNLLPNISKEVIQPLFFLELDLPSGWIHFTSHNRDISIGNKIYTAVGYLGKVSFSGEHLGTEISKVDFDLNGLPVELYKEIEQEIMFKKEAILLMAMADKDFNLLENPIRVFSGKVSRVRMAPLPTLSISIEVSGRLATVRKTAPSRYTNADQQAKFNKDKGLEFVAKMASVKLYWG